MKHKIIKIAHITQTLSGGMHTYFRHVLPKLVQKGFEVTLLCPTEKYKTENKNLLDELSKKGITVINIPMKKQINPFVDLYSFSVILVKMLKYKFDIVHSHCSKAGALARTVAVIAGIKTTIHSSHCFAFQRTKKPLKKLIYTYIEKFLAKITTTFVAVSHSDAQTAIKTNIFPEKKCKIIQNGLPANSANEKKLPLTTKIMKASLGISPQNKTITCASRLVPYKGILNLLCAAKRCKTEKITFLIAGEGKLKKTIKQFILKNKLSKNVNLAGQIRNMNEIYSVTDICILCSDVEAQPYVILEAMRSHCPVIATNVPGNRELLQNNRGALVESDPKALAKAIDDLIANPKKQKQYAENAYRYFKRHHALENQISKLTNLYNSYALNQSKINAIPEKNTK